MKLYKIVSIISFLTIIIIYLNVVSSHNTFLNIVGKISYTQLKATSTPLTSTIVNSSTNISNIKAMWVWEPEYILESENEINELIKFCTIQNINRLYFEVENTVDERISNLIKKLHDNNIKIEALSGKEHYIYRKNHDTALEFVNIIAKYNLKTESNRKFDGIHFDHEPFLLPEFDSDSDVLIAYLELLDKANKLIKSYDKTLIFSTDIACWYDSGDIFAKFNNERKTLDKHSIDLTDYVVIMDYTNIYKDIISNAKGEIEYCNKNQKKVVIALETQYLPDEPSYVSYYDMGEKKLKYHIKRFDNYFSKELGYAGYAIHYYNSYKKLKKY